MRKVNIADLGCNTLRELLRKRDLALGGRKSDLIERLSTHLGADTVDVSDDENIAKDTSEDEWRQEIIELKAQMEAIMAAIKAVSVPAAPASLVPASSVPNATQERGIMHHVIHHPETTNQNHSAPQATVNENPARETTHIQLHLPHESTHVYELPAGQSTTHTITTNEYEARSKTRRGDKTMFQEFTEDDGQIFTPFIVAAKNGRYNVVSTLIGKYKPDLEKECMVKFDGHVVSGATALWCAATSGHMNVVKLLVKHGANVNHKTKAQSTPLRAACFDGRMDIVRYLIVNGADVNLANAYNNTCLMISAYKGHTDVVEYLLEMGADANEQALCGATALHYAAECGNVEICRALLDYGAELKQNEFGMTPVIVAAERTRETVVELFCTRPDLLTKREKIDALELMGASFANDKDNYNLGKSFHYLMQAMELRYEDPDNAIKKNLSSPVPAYENWIESQTVQDLQAIRFNSNSMHMESLTIRERILGRKCSEVAHPIVFRGAVCADNGRFDRCENLWMHALEIRQENMLSVQRDLLRFAQVFSQMIHINVPLRVNNILKVLASCILEIEQNKQKMADPGPKDDVEVLSEEYEQNIVTALYLLTLLTRVLKRPNQQIGDSHIATLYKLVFTLCKMNLKLRDGQTLLHLAVNGVTPVDDFHTNDVCRFPCVDTVKLLLHCGAIVSECDCDRNTPLHTLTATIQTARVVENNDIIATVEEITRLLIEAGIHLDAVNNDGLTAAQLCTSHGIVSLVRSYEMHLMTLKCLTSRCITFHKLKYRGYVPQHLETFIQLHCANKHAD